MNNSSTTKFHILSHPIAAAHPVLHGPDATSEPAAASSSEAAGTSAGGGARRGRPTICSDKVLAMIKDYARRLGFSDSAAAEAAGVSSSTISRWKQENPEIAHELLQARQECRIHHLERIMAFAEGDDNRGLRASMWLLERLFPGDYAPRMAERFAHRNFEDRAREREEAALADERRREVLAEKEARAAEAQEKYLAVLAGYEAEIARSAGTAPREESDPPAGPAPVAAGVLPRENGASTSESASHNSRNAAPAEPEAIEETAHFPAVGDCQSQEPGRPRPIDPDRASALSITRDDSSAHEHTDESAAARDGSMGRGRPGSLNEAAPAEVSLTTSEGASHNSRNSAPSTGSGPAASLGPEARPAGDSVIF